MMKYISAVPPKTIDRFMSAFIPVSESGCWIWMKALVRKQYGIIRVQGRLEHAHRISYKIFKGVIPDGMQIDHLCRVHQCVNPDHLRIVTSKENTMIGNGVTAINQKKTHCVHGHPFSVDNTLLRFNSSDGHTWRRCRECMKRYNRKF